MVYTTQKKSASRKLVPQPVPRYKVLTVSGSGEPGDVFDIQVAVTRIKPGSVVSVRLFAHQTLTCRGGRLWITRSGDSADYWLVPGQALRFPASCRLVVEADGVSAFALQGLPHRAGSIGGLPDILAAWLRRVASVLRKLASV